VNLFEVNPETCNQDGICAEICPSRIIHFRKSRYPSPTAGAEAACIRCGHCVAVCPSGSLSHRALPVEQCPPVNRDFQLSPEQCEHFLRARRSIRTYKKKAVPGDEIQRVIEMARYAPTGRNAQDAQWLVLGKRAEIHNLARLVVAWMQWMTEHETEVAAAMHLDQTVRLWQSGDDIIFRNAPVLIVAHAEKGNIRALESCTIALSYLELAATSMGLGCCWAGYFMRAAAVYQPLKEALPLPGGHQSFGAMMLGYPKYKYHRLPLRKVPEITWRL